MFVTSFLGFYLIFEIWNYFEMLHSGMLRSEMLQATVLVGLQRMIGQSTNSVASYIGCALIGLYKTTLQDLTNQNIQNLFSAETYTNITE